MLRVSVGCEEKQKAMENLAADNQVVKAASAAANEVVRNATDCGVAKPLIPEAYKQIEEAKTERQGRREPADPRHAQAAGRPRGAIVPCRGSVRQDEDTNLKGLLKQLCPDRVPDQLSGAERPPCPR